MSQHLTVTQHKDTRLTFKRHEAFAEVHVTLLTAEGVFVTVVLDIESAVQVIGQMDETREKPASWWRRLFT